MDIRTSFWDKMVKDHTGHYALVAAPNVPLVLALTASIFAKFLPGLGGSIAQFMALGLWFTWSWLEISSGVNYFRRLLGLLVFVGLLYSNLSNGRF